MSSYYRSGVSAPSDVERPTGTVRFPDNNVPVRNPRDRSPAQEPSLADTLGGAGHDIVYGRFCVELMVGAIDSIHAEAPGVIPPEAAAVG
jgi:hypothetical protein